MMLKTLKYSLPPCAFCVCTRQKIEHSFSDQVAIDAKSALTLEKPPLVAEVKPKT